MNPYKIVAVDSDPTLLGLIEDLLCFEGYAVQGYLASEVSTASIAQAEPDVVLLDICTHSEHEMLALIEQLRHHTRTSNTPVVMSSTDPKLLLRVSRLLGPPNYILLEKPFEMHRFLSCIEHAIHAHCDNRGMSHDWSAYLY